jgi:murein DD-endopeptidase MepM/ murein hydrolase activator NlpD
MKMSKRNYITILVFGLVLIAVNSFIAGRYTADFNSIDTEPEVIIQIDTVRDTIEVPFIDTMYTNETRHLHYRADTFLDSATIMGGEYHPPVMVGKHTSGYGWRWGRMHEGVDIAYNNKDTSYSTFAGVVRYARGGYNGGYGKLVIVRHFNGLETYYAHHWNLLVEEGDTVSAGTPLGIIGSTGRSNGPHLHFEVRFLGESMDPDDFFNVMSDTSDFVIRKKHSYYEVIY